MIWLITAGMLLVAAAILAAFVRLVLRDGGEPDPQGADVSYAAELHDINAESPAAAVEPQPAAESGQRRLASDWRDLVTPLPVPELGGTTYTGRHHDDTVEIVAGTYMPLYGPEFADAMGYDRHDTAYMEPIR